MDLGTSTVLKPTSKAGCVNILPDGTKDDCHYLGLPYLDKEGT